MPQSKKLTLAEIRRRARQIKLVLTDVDGVLTDTGVYYSAMGEELKRFSIRDGMGMERLRDMGISTAMMTREASPRVEARSKQLKLPFYFPGIWNKREELSRVLSETGFEVSQLAYIGDDLNDVEVMAVIRQEGLTCSPADAMPEAKAVAHYIAKATGGNGAFRDFAEWILKNRK
ncbi:MAG: HAD-IIIA family hydrolase [Bacteroidota bacterium]|nr:HAD-IIIA family hydrolase [Bacteroidota bacterium]MDP4234580.1 HAD-IIIA family hydrolase [Bacteroidota bacterium]MDP4243709.1 HAD-IIIA family hydrolase [Bacteroidota bacterium]MDP4288343.1 HAD-IIIA family hydrolase [Bacteroidota bacterium]